MGINQFFRQFYTRKFVFTYKIHVKEGNVVHTTNTLFMGQFQYFKFRSMVSFTKTIAFSSL